MDSIFALSRNPADLPKCIHHQAKGFVDQLVEVPWLIVRLHLLSLRLTEFKSIASLFIPRKNRTTQYLRCLLSLLSMLQSNPCIWHLLIFPFFPYSLWDVDIDFSWMSVRCPKTFLLLRNFPDTALDSVTLLTPFQSPVLFESNRQAFSFQHNACNQ